MARKKWYKIYVGETVKNKQGEHILFGSMQLVAQVKSPGLASHVYQKLLEIYPAPRFIVTLE